MKINYTRIGDYELPNLTINSKTIGEINRYGILRLNYLKGNNKALYTTLLMNDELTNHLISISNEAEERLNFLIESYKKMMTNCLKKVKEVIILNGQY